MGFIYFIIAVLIIIVLLVLFSCGPDILTWFTDKVDEWEEVLESLHNEK